MEALEQKQLRGENDESKGRKRAKLKYDKCICAYCFQTLSCKNSLNRHLASCNSLACLLANEKERSKVNPADIEMRQKQQELIKKMKERANTFITCSFCNDVISEKDKSLHLQKIHNFPVYQ